MKWNEKVDGHFENCYEELLAALPKEKGWIRK